MKKIASLLTLMLPLLLLFSAFAQAIDLDGSGSFTATGFYNLTGAEVVNGSAQGSSTPWMYQQWHCPCSIQNWEYAGVYEKSKGFRLDQESLFGLQLRKEFTPTLSVTGQFVMRAQNPNNGSSPSVDWLYASWSPAPDSPFTFQVGRLRIPLYYYSDYLYIGYSYPWVRPPPDVYGWPIYEYDGGNASYHIQLGKSAWTMNASVWTGNFKQTYDAYDTLIYDTNPTTESWKKMWGSYVSMTNGTFDVRAMAMEYRDTTTINNPGAPATTVVSNQFTRIEGLSANMDYQNWVVRGEIDRYQQQSTALGINNVYKYNLLGVGYKVGDFTPMLTHSQYTTVAQPIEAQKTNSIVVRWDFRPNTALKVQYDVNIDESQYPYKFFGNSHLLSVSLQGIF
ncbi:hypothetical protein [Solimicrobium silvestre]|nr:hypothetical protein [Solimicrobium silvestre]